MPKVNTKERIMKSALRLFSENGYAATSIGAIESAAGLRPRAGAFYRHFSGKLTLLEALAHEYITETPEDFDFGNLRAFGNTRAELVSIARTFETAVERQRPYLRLVEELRRTGVAAKFERQRNEEMLRALMRWVAGKPAGKRLRSRRLAALTMSVFGGWLFYQSKRQQGIELDTIDGDVLLEEWAFLWAKLLDTPVNRAS